MKISEGKFMEEYREYRKMCKVYGVNDERTQRER